MHDSVAVEKAQGLVLVEEAKTTPKGEHGRERKIHDRSPNTLGFWGWCSRVLMILTRFAPKVLKCLR